MILNALDKLTFGTDYLLEEFFSLKARRKKDQIRLNDGRRVHFCSIERACVQELFDLYVGLSPASKRTRFCSDLSNVANSFFRNLAQATVMGDGFVVLDCDSQKLIGVCQLIQDDGQGAEFALTIADDWQGVGLGKAMMKQLIKLAKENRQPVLEAVVAHENSGMKLLLMRAGYHLSKTDYSNCAQYKLFLS